MEKLTDHQIETLAEHWPWEYEESEQALRLAEKQGWPLDDTVRALDRVAEEFGICAHPVRVIEAAIETRRIRDQEQRHLHDPS